MQNKCNKIWSNLIHTNRLKKISKNEFIELAKEKNLIVDSIVDVKYGMNFQIEAYLIYTQQGRALFPKCNSIDIDGIDNERNFWLDYEKFWIEMDWFFPVYYSINKLDELLKLVHINRNGYKGIPSERLQHDFEHALPMIYSIPLMVQNISEKFENSKILAKHVPLLKESILSFYSGYAVSATAALIPIVEDSLKRILELEAIERSTITDKVNTCIDLAVEKCKFKDALSVDWIPSEFEEKDFLKISNSRIFLLETFRSWLLNSFYACDDQYNKVSGFNRHHFAHGLSNVWQNSTNFFRMMGVLNQLLFVEALIDDKSNINFLDFNLTNRTDALNNEINVCINLRLLKSQLLLSDQQNKLLPFNVTPTDDGWLARSSILSKTMNDEIILVLKNSGWQCFNFSDPVKEGNYITVAASKNEIVLKIALLFSCATDNKIYKELEKDSYDFILYSGSFYNQNSYAYGVTKSKVMPLNAWIVPN